MAPKIAIVFVCNLPPPPPLFLKGSFSLHFAFPVLQYSLYGHIVKLAEAEKKGIESAGGQVDIYQYV